PEQLRCSLRPPMSTRRPGGGYAREPLLWACRSTGIASATSTPSLIRMPSSCAMAVPYLVTIVDVISMVWRGSRRKGQTERRTRLAHDGPSWASEDSHVSARQSSRTWLCPSVPHRRPLHTPLEHETGPVRPQ